MKTIFSTPENLPIANVTDQQYEYLKRFDWCIDKNKEAFRVIVENNKNYIIPMEKEIYFVLEDTDPKDWEEIRKIHENAEMSSQHVN